MVLPQRIKEFKSPSTHVYKFKLLNQERVLEHNNEKCVGCGLCIHACPITGKVISWGTTHEEYIVIDLVKCVHCGVCAYFCPSGALKLFINGEERIELKENVEQLERHSLPDLEPVMLGRTTTGAPILKYLQGTLKIPDKLEPSESMNAMKACPTGALSQAGNRIVLDENKCFYCDACSHAAGGKIVPIRTRLLIDFKDGVSPIVTRIIERMMDEQAASRILKGASGYKAREKTKLLIDHLGE
nr:4Fe-4S binding protein [Candidatus Sigynarchaeota archaeon]